MSVITDLVARLRGTPAVEHPVLGRIYASHRPKQGLWGWQTLDELEHVRGRLRVTWESGPGGPTAQQLEFWKWLQGHISDVVRQARPLLEAELPLSPNPWRDLIWVGASLPVDGGRESDWQVSFGSPVNRDAKFTVHFADGEPARLSLG